MLSPAAPRSASPRRRWLVVITLVGVVAAGVASRRLGAGVPWVGKELGGILWAVMFYLLAVLAAPRLSPTAAAAAALGLSAGTEFLQLYKAPWIEAARAKPIGGLLLGHSFAWRDIACYSVGALAAWAVDRNRRRH